MSLVLQRKHKTAKAKWKKNLKSHSLMEKNMKTNICMKNLMKWRNAKTWQQWLENMKKLFEQTKNIISTAYQQGKVFQKFKEKEKFVKVIRNFNLNKSMIIFKINIVEMVNKYPKLKNLLLSRNYVKTYFKRMLRNLNR